MIENRIRALIESLGYLWSRNAKRLWSFVIRVGKLSESGSSLVHYTGQTDTDFNTNNGHMNSGWSACAQIPIKLMVLWKEAGGPVLTLEAFTFQTQLFIYLPFSISQLALFI